MKRITLFFVSAFLVTLLSSSVFGQRTTTTVHDSDVMYKKRVTRALDLRELQNQPFMARNNEITKLLIEAVRENQIKMFTSDSLDAGSQLSTNDFFKRLEIPSTEVEPDTAFMDEFEKQEYLASKGNKRTDYYFAKDLYQMELVEDVIFDKQRSQWKYDIVAINLFIPADHPDNIRGIQQHLATFSYDDCEELFNEDPRAIWYNPQNDGEHRTLADAFNLRMFSSYIVKISNPNDDFLQDIYTDPQTSRYMSEAKAMELLEFEHNLWEF